MKSVALVGFATQTRDGVKQSSADEIWSLNWAYTYDFIPRIDRLFEMHPIWLFSKTKKKAFVKPRNHWKWLHQERPFPVYMLKNIRDIPNCISYPIDDVTEAVFGRKLLRAEIPQDFYSSSFDFMMGLAIAEGFERIELYGFEMGSQTEYSYQREGAAFFIGNAVGRGIEVVLPKETVLLFSKKYGYEGGQMIFRQDLEAHLLQYDTQRRDEMARLQKLEGSYAEAERNEDIKRMDELALEIRDQRDRACIAAGAYQCVSFMIQHVDLKEPELKLLNPIETI